MLFTELLCKRKLVSLFIDAWIEIIRNIFVLHNYKEYIYFLHNYKEFPRYLPMYVTKAHHVLFNSFGIGLFLLVNLIFLFSRDYE